jgi:hypothetical protein
MSGKFTDRCAMDLLENIEVQLDNSKSKESTIINVISSDGKH